MEESLRSAELGRHRHADVGQDAAVEAEHGVDGGVHRVDAADGPRAGEVLPVEHLQGAVSHVHRRREVDPSEHHGYLTQDELAMREGGRPGEQRGKVAKEQD